MKYSYHLLQYLLIVIIVVTGCTQEIPGTSSPNNKSDSANLDVRLSQAVSTKIDKGLSYEARLGKYYYEKYCSVCHGLEGKGDGFNAFNLDPKPRNFTDSLYMNALSDARLFEVISQGGRGVNKSILMPSWSGRMSKEEIEFTISYVRSFPAKYGE